ncbi:GNAT family N-acetyltransferase [Streptomyces qinzhouensis]|uniref:GNAT family N-acetyltransferase n=1 Tax=Streptomyces qinzhouensis TaxID=2599401 RepID=A0A5B8JH55_9ACTN|nr:GNAT family N-acetyltransferase [Streptomyces qinzhouensis]QDY79181.1 GNAT family N-acetyltransferase [Streptomyces qinzhouensis]
MSTTPPAAPATPPAIVHTWQLAPAELAEIRALLHDAFEGDFSDEDFEHGLGGLHALVRDPGGRLAAHGSVVMRRVGHGGRWYRVGYVESVGVHADFRRRGLGGTVLAALEQIVDRAYDFGALSASDEGEKLYRARGWRPWRGRIEAMGPEGLVRLPDEEGSTYVRGGSGGIPAPEDALAFDWRNGDIL